MRIINPAEDFSDLDQEKLEYYEGYLRRYYSVSFRKNQGTEEILSMLSRFARPGKWLDVGAGPATLFWALALEEIQSLDCSEICVEGIKVLHDFVQSGVLPDCYSDAAKLMDFPIGRVDNVRRVPIRYMIFDAMAPWPASIRGTCDLVTAFGVYGLSSNEDAYIRNFGYMRPAIKENGHAVGANWIRSPAMIAQHGGDNRYLNPGLIGQAADRFGYEILHLSEVRIVNDPNYDRVILWALKPLCH